MILSFLSPVNSNASDVDIKPKLSDAHMMGEAEGSLISQEGEEPQVIESGKSTPTVISHYYLVLINFWLLLTPENIKPKLSETYMIEKAEGSLIS